MEPAAIPTRTVGSSRTSTIGLAGALGFLLAFGVMLLLEAFDDTVREPGTLHTYIDLPTVATVTPSNRGAIPESKSFGAIRNYLLRSRTDDALRVLITSPTPHVGVTSTARGIAEAFARSGRRVILVDANVTAPTLHEQYQVPLSPGLTDAIRWPSVVQHALHPSSVANLMIVPAGETTSDDALAGPGISLVFDALLRDLEGDVLVVDGGTIEDATSATCILAAQLPYTILVVDARTRLRMLRSATEALTESGTQLLGIVFSKHGRRRRAETHPVRAASPKLLSKGSDPSSAPKPTTPVPLHPLVRNGTTADADDTFATEATRLVP